MKKEDLLALLESYKPEGEDEKRFKQQFIEFLNNNDVFLGKENQSGHITGGAWIVNRDRSKVLLTHHRKLDMWIQLGGHTEKGETILENAEREGKEESGLKSIRPLSMEIFDIDAHIIPARPNEPEHFHYEIRFLFEADENEKITKVDRESKDVRWISLDSMSDFKVDEQRARMVRKTVKLREKYSLLDSFI